MEAIELTELLANPDALQGAPLLVPIWFWFCSVLHEIGAVSLSFLAALGDGSANAGECLLAFGHDGQGGRLPGRTTNPAFSGYPFGTIQIVSTGAVTAIVGGFLAWQQTDLKRILAYSTISASGMLMLLLGLGTPLAIKAAVVFLLAHSLYKAALFMVAGTVDHAAGTRDVRELGGLARRLPLLAIAAALAGISLAGLPPAAGFLAKELVYEASLADVPGKLIALTTALVASISSSLWPGS